MSGDIVFTKKNFLMLGGLLVVVVVAVLAVIVAREQNRQNVDLRSQATNETVETTSSTSTPSAKETKCQGNSKASGRCFSCKRDDPEDQLNIFDFSCFSKWYGDNVGIGI